jgi:NAD(P)-dependent dehydrogenase (short-subunit alcohol dehydrogenase family)
LSKRKLAPAIQRVVREPRGFDAPYSSTSGPHARAAYRAGDVPIVSSSLLQRMVEPEEVANMVTYLSSPLSSATNGAALRVEGGIIPTLN